MIEVLSLSPTDYVAISTATVAIIGAISAAAVAVINAVKGGNKAAMETRVAQQNETITAITGGPSQVTPPVPPSPLPKTDA